MLAHAVVEPHADEAAIVADRAVEAVAAHVDLGRLRQLEIGERRQAAVGLALVHAGEPGAHLGGEREGGAGHAERGEDPLLHHLAQTLAGDAFHHLAGPVDVATIFPVVAGVEQQRRDRARPWTR